MMNLILQTAAGRVAAKSAAVMEMDPHGWTLTLICVTVVFAALITLFLAYSASGAVFTWKKDGKVSDEELAAIAAALDDYLKGDGTQAQDSEVHDLESGIITIKNHRQ